MADEVNQYAFEGGDTEAETAAAIKTRNEALQTHKDEMADINQTLAEAQQAAIDSSAAAETKIAETLAPPEPVLPDNATPAPPDDKPAKGPKA